MSPEQQEFLEIQKEYTRAKASAFADRALAIKKIKEKYGDDVYITKDKFAEVGYDFDAETVKYLPALQKLQNAQKQLRIKKIEVSPLDPKIEQDIEQEVANEKGITSNDILNAKTVFSQQKKPKEETGTPNPPSETKPNPDTPAKPELSQEEIEQEQKAFIEASKEYYRAHSEFLANRARLIKKIREKRGNDATIVEQDLTAEGYDYDSEAAKRYKATEKLQDIAARLKKKNIELPVLDKAVGQNIMNEVAKENGVTTAEMAAAKYPLTNYSGGASEKGNDENSGEGSETDPKTEPEKTPDKDPSKTPSDDKQQKTTKNTGKKPASADDAPKEQKDEKKNPIEDSSAGGKTAVGYGDNLKTTSIFSETNVSFSGHDMVVVFEIPVDGGASISEVIGSLQTITYSVHQEKSPVRGIGDMNAKGYVFGPRTIAGTMIFTVFNKHWAKSIMNKYLQAVKKSAHFLADELPPFNVTISCANEYGNKAHLALFGVTFVNEGQIMSINDNYTENTFEFFATDVDYLDDIDRGEKSLSPKTNNNGSISSKGNTTPAPSAPKPVKDPNEKSNNDTKIDKEKDEYKVQKKDPKFEFNVAELNKMPPKSSSIIIDETIKNLDKELSKIQTEINKAKKGTKEYTDLQNKLRKTRDSLKMAKDLKKQNDSKMGLLSGDIQFIKKDDKS